MKRLFILALVIPLFAVPACSSNPEIRRGQTTGAMVGGLTVGLLSDSWGGAAVGAAVGGLVGGEVARNR